MAARKKTPPQYTYYTYTAADDTDAYWRVGFSLLALPFVVLAGTLRQGVRSFTAFARGVAAGLGLGSSAQALPARQPPHEAQDGREPAYPQYLFGQAWRDVKHTVVVAVVLQIEGVKGDYKRVRARRFLPPEENAPDRRNGVLGTGQVLAIGLGFAVADIVLLVVLLAQAVALGLLWAGGIVVIYALRLVDSALLRVRRIRITCPNPQCHVRIPYPSYRCPGCATVHRDVRPGRYGMIHRSCRCGDRLPTLLMLGSHRMKAVCPRCGKDLEHGAGNARELILPIFGASGAGKTQFLSAVAVATTTMLHRAGNTIDPADDYSQNWYRHVTDLHSRGGTVTKTTAASQHAVSLRLTVGRRRLLIKMFDAAGETFQRAERIRDLHYLRGGGTLVFVLDPLSVPAIWDTIDEERRRALASVRARDAPLAIFQQTVQTLHQVDIDPRRFRLAVIVSKADLIAPEIEKGHLGDSPSIQEWLETTLEQGTLVRAVGHEFGSARFFLTNAVLGGGTPHPSIETFTGWLLADEGMRF